MRIQNNSSALWLAVPGFDDLLLTGETPSGGADGFSITAVGDALSWGSGETIDIAVQRWMADGAIESVQGYDNREITFGIVTEGPTTSDLTAAETAFFRRAEYLNRHPGIVGSLRWTPPEGEPAAPVTVFEVWTCQLAHAFDGVDELYLQRAWNVTMKAKPWTRSAGLTVSPAVPTSGSPTITQIDACTSVSGWTGAPNTPTSSAGAVIESAPVSVSGTPLVVGRTLTRTGTVSAIASQPYLMLDTSSAGAKLNSLTVRIDGQTLSKAAQIGSVSYWRIPVGVTSFARLDVIALMTVSVSGTVSLSVADVSKTDTIGGIGSHRQFVRHVDVGGGVITSGSIQVASPSGVALGNTLVYTCRDDASGYTPPLRLFRSDGNTVTPDATCVSGNREALVAAGGSAGTITYTIPAGRLAEASYVVFGRFLFGSAATMTVTITAKVNGFPAVTITRKLPSILISGVVWGVLGALNLPSSALPASSQLPTVITISATADSGSHSIDELFLFDVTHGSTPTLVTSGTPAFTRLWIDAPDADPVRNRPAIYIGNQDDRSDAATPTPGAILASVVQSRGDHDLDPHGVMLFTVTDGVNDAAATASFYRRWHTHAGD